MKVSVNFEFIVSLRLKKAAAAAAAAAAVERSPRCPSKIKRLGSMPGQAMHVDRPTNRPAGPHAHARIVVTQRTHTSLADCTTAA